MPDRSQAIEVPHVDAAAEELVRRRDTHLDSLAVRLTEPRVRAVIEPIVSGGTLDRVPEDDRQFVVDLVATKI